jgi:hypothetical protein
MAVRLAVRLRMVVLLLLPLRLQLQTFWLQTLALPVPLS